MRKKKLLKTGIIAASFAAMIPMATMNVFASEVFAEEQEETAVVAEAEAEQETEVGAETPKLAPAEKKGWVQEDGGWRYYKEDGDYYVAGIYLIGSDYYGFKWNGLIYDDCTFEVDDFYYRAKP